MFFRGVGLLQVAFFAIQRAKKELQHRCCIPNANTKCTLRLSAFAVKLFPLKNHLPAQVGVNNFGV